MNSAGAYPRTRLIANLGFDKFGQKNELFLPAEVAHLGGDHVGHAFLHDVHFRPARHLLQGDRRLYFPRHIRVVELVRVTDPFIRHELSVCAAESVAMAGAKIGERHPVAAADFRVHLVNLAGKSIRWQPLCHRLRIKKRAVNLLRLCPEHSMNADRIRCHGSHWPTANLVKSRTLLPFSSHVSDSVLSPVPRCPPLALSAPFPPPARRE